MLSFLGNKWKCHCLCFWIIFYNLSTTPTTRVTKEPYLPTYLLLLVLQRYPLCEGDYISNLWPSCLMPLCTPQLYRQKHVVRFQYSYEQPYTTTGNAGSLLRAVNAKKTSHAQQVSSCALRKLCNWHCTLKFSRR